MTRMAAIRTSVEHGSPLGRTPRPVERRNIVPARYEIRIAGQLDQIAAAAFAGLDVTAYGDVTVVRGEFDQACLHGLLERIRSLGLDLVEARRVRDSPGYRAN
jgi:hypothetical protein